MERLLDQIDNYAQRYQTLTGHRFSDASIFEIGYGARPNRLLALISLGYNAKGIDIDQPILKSNFSSFVQIYRKNGIKRLIKSLIRNLLFDRHERHCLDRVLKKRGVKLIYDESRFLIGDAGAFEFPSQRIDFIFSEDVFPHIAPKSLHSLCKNLSDAMSINGVIFINLGSYAGLPGGHLVEWYPHTLDNEHIQRKSEPWEHLRKRRLLADCYLNELRICDFVDIFKGYFDIVDIVNKEAGLGKKYLTKEIRDELSKFSEEELLSHIWTFVLRKKSGE